MTEHYAKNAQYIVDSFKELLDDETAAAVGEDQFDQLKMLIEAAIANLLLQNMERVADQVEDLAHSIRNDAENFDDN